MHMLIIKHSIANFLRHDPVYFKLYWGEPQSLLYEHYRYNIYMHMNA